MVAEAPVELQDVGVFGEHLQLDLLHQLVLHPGLLALLNVDDLHGEDESGGLVLSQVHISEAPLPQPLPDRKIVHRKLWLLAIQQFHCIFVLYCRRFDYRLFVAGRRAALSRDHVAAGFDMSLPLCQAAQLVMARQVQLGGHERSLDAGC